MQLARLARCLMLIAMGLAGCAPSLSFTSRTDEGRPVQVSGVLTLPEGQGPHPAVVLMHGSSGVGPTLATNWPQAFRKAGIATLAIDSFTGRGLTSTVTALSMDKFHLPTELVWDAHAAANWLRARPGIDSKRLVLMGQSLGGIVALNAQQRIAGIRFDDFAAFVAVYPLCGGTPMNVTYERPTLILIGAEDDWTPADQCVLLAAYKKEMRDPTPELIVYPGAVHSFDIPSRGSGIMNVHIAGRNVAVKSYFSASTTAAAEAVALAFISRHLALAPRR